MDNVDLLLTEKYELPILIAGHIYTFWSNESVDLGEIPTQRQLDDPKVRKHFIRTHSYYDKRPVCVPLIHENHRDFELVLNLKVMPKELKNKLLLPLFKRGVLESESIRKIEDEKQRKLSLTTTDKHLAIFNINAAEKLIGVPLDPYLNKYNRKDIVAPKLVDWKDTFKILMINWENDPNIKRN